MTPEEQLDEARAKEAWRIWNEEDGVTDEGHAVIAARLARENWTPPEPVDPDILAYRKWASHERHPDHAIFIKGGDVDKYITCDAFLAGARMAREQERERAKGLVDQAKAIIDQHARLLARLPLGLRADIGIEWQTMMDATASFYNAFAKYEEPDQ